MDKISLPETLQRLIQNESDTFVQDWWNALDGNDRTELKQLWDSRIDSYFFRPQRSDAGAMDNWDETPNIINGKFVPHDDSIRMEEWLDDWLEYLHGHDEVVMLPRVVIAEHTSGVCQLEPSAQEVIKRGILPTNFQCSRNDNDCPMLQLQKHAPGMPLFIIGPSQRGGWWIAYLDTGESAKQTT